MSAEEIKQAQAALEVFIQEHFHAEKPRYDYGEWFDPLYFDLAEYVGRKGKRIRPLAFLLAYQAFGGTRPLSDPRLLQCATALELLHTFVLMHDDVIDRSDTRRNLPTFHRLVAQRMGGLEGAMRTGENVAIVMGDIVFAGDCRAGCGGGSAAEHFGCLPGLHGGYGLWRDSGHPLWRAGCGSNPLCGH
jgi:geranylgeranyl pyrophosphate synthase